MDLCVGSLDSKINGGEICRADSATTHTILRNQKYFSHITLVETNVNTISGLVPGEPLLCYHVT